MSDDNGAINDETTGRDILEAFNAEEIVDRPGEPPTEERDIASNTDAPPPPG